MKFGDMVGVEDKKKMDSDGKIKPIPLIKSCSDCRATRTPLWRGGPAGPKSLCNACGIKYNKKRRQLLGLETARSRRKKKRSAVNELRKFPKMLFTAPGSDVVSLREEERAALLLMSFSCGAVYS